MQPDQLCSILQSVAAGTRTVEAALDDLRDLPYYGRVRVKVARWPGDSRCMPEYEDCRQAAQNRHVPLAEVMAAARENASQL